MARTRCGSGPFFGSGTRGTIDVVKVLIVDGANVVGSVPDGWWRDRAGAASRLHDGLARGRWPYDRVVLVVEGQARKGVEAGVIDGLTTVHAPGEGDDEIVAQCRVLAERGDDVTVATADRGLIARLTPLGAAITGPRDFHPGR